ncbi:unnamed protein product [Closterium sp. NIES-64]|nr:unnamed protein product [Closterium sp. NIES-64]
MYELDIPLAPQLPAHPRAIAPLRAFPLPHPPRHSDTSGEPTHAMHATRSWDAHEQAEGPSPLKMLRGYLLRLRHAGPLPARLDPYRRGCARGGVAGGMWGTVRGEGGGGAGEDGGGGEAWGEDVVGLFRQLHEEHARNIPLDVLSMKARPVADSPAALGARALYRKMVCSQRGGSCFESNVLFAWVLRHHLACQVDLLPALSCHSPHSPRHHHSPPSSSRRSSRPPPVPAATLNAASPAAAPSPDDAAACMARLSSPADSAQQPVQSASAAASSASAELADHMCLLVHINGMAWLADHQDAGVYRISPCAPPHPPAPGMAAPWGHGRGAGAVSVAPACTAESQEKPVAAVAAADRGREGWRAVEGGVQGWEVEHVEGGMDGRMGEGSAGLDADSNSDPDDDDDDDDAFYREGLGGDTAPCPPWLTHAAGGQAAAVRAGEQWYAVERLCRVGPSEAGGRWVGADGEQAAWGEAACEEEAQWQPLYRFSTWPRDTAHFLQCMRHASPLGGPRVAVRVCSEGEVEAEGRGVIREMIRDRHLLLLDGHGRVQRQQQLATDDEFSAVVRGRFGIRLGADDVIAMPPVPREPPLGDVWLASEW